MGITSFLFTEVMSWYELAYNSIIELCDKAKVTSQIIVVKMRSYIGPLSLIS